MLFRSPQTPNPKPLGDQSRNDVFIFATRFELNFAIDFVYLMSFLVTGLGVGFSISLFLGFSTSGLASLSAASNCTGTDEQGNMEGQCFYLGTIFEIDLDKIEGDELVEKVQQTCD